MDHLHFWLLGTSRVLVMGLVLSVIIVLLRRVGERGRAIWDAKDDPSEKELLEAFKTHGRDVNAIVHLYGGVRFATIESENGSKPGLIGYVSLDHEQVALSEPLTAPEQTQDALRTFADFAQEKGKAALLFAVREPVARQAQELGYGVLQVGSESFFDLTTYDPAQQDPKLISAVRQAEKKGIVFEEAPREFTNPLSPLGKEVREVFDQWLFSRKNARYQLISEVSPFKCPDQKRYFVARQGDRVQAFLACSAVPAARGMFLHDLIRRPTAINGVSEGLILKAFSTFKNEGLASASLGIAPLSGLSNAGVNSNYPKFNRLMNWVFETHDASFGFKSLYRFKKKFRPTSEVPTFVCFYPGRLRLRYVIAIASVLSPKGFLGFLLHKWRQWSAGDHLPRPLLRLMREDILVLPRLAPFTFSELRARARFTTAVLFLNTYTYLNSTGFNGRLYNKTLDQYGFTFQSFLDQQWYVLVTSNFIHFNFWHLLANMVMLITLAGTLELLVGSWLTALVYVIGMNSNIPNGLLFLPLLKHLDIDAFSKTMYFVDVGASLGIMATLGALIHLFRNRKTWLISAFVTNVIVAYYQGSFFGIDHCFSLLMGYGVAALYVRGVFRGATITTLSPYLQTSTIRNSPLPFRSRMRT